MTKESKTVSTIRRRKGKQVAIALQKIREENPKPVCPTEEEIAAAEVEDKCYLFDDRVLGPIMLRRLMSDNHSLFLALLAIRCANALFIQTSFVPDEYWQSLEVAHNMVFGYGYLTWEWKEKIRGYTHPLIFAFFYKILHILNLDTRMMLIKVPRLVQGFIAAWGDLHLYKLSSRMSGRATAQWSLLCQVLSWFTIYCCTRTLSNSTETALVTAALSYFPWPDSPSKPKDMYKFLLFAALSVVVRPTSGLIWFLLSSWHLQRVYGSAVFPGVMNAYVLIGSLSLGASAVIDRIWYGQWTIVQFNFLWFNVVKGGASIYGVHPWHWYFFQGFPVIMGTLIFPFAVGAWRAKNKTLLWIILWILATHSFLPHKEFRFILPALPLAMHYCGVYFQSLCSKPQLRKFKPPKKEENKSSASESIDNAQNELDVGENEDGADEQSAKKKTLESSVSREMASGKDSEKRVESDTKEQPGISKSDVKDSGDAAELEKEVMEEETAEGREEKSLVESTSSRLTPEKEELLEEKSVTEETRPEVLRDAHHRRNLIKAKIFVIALVVTNLLPAMYFCLIHQRGTVMVTKFLYDASLSHPKTDVLFLMPCHSTPYYSYIHRNISMRFLTCEPNLHSMSNYTDEADAFYTDPKEWLRKEYSKSSRPWPSHIVYFNTLHKDISSTLVQSGYKICENIFHTHFPEGRVGTSITVSCR